MFQLILVCIIINARKLSLGQGNIFTGVFLSTGGGSASVHAGIPPPPGADTLPRKQTPPKNGQQAGSMYPTGMQSCLIPDLTTH